MKFGDNNIIWLVHYIVVYRLERINKRAQTCITTRKSVQIWKFFLVRILGIQTEYTDLN